MAATFTLKTGAPRTETWLPSGTHFTFNAMVVSGSEGPTLEVTDRRDYDSLVRLSSILDFSGSTDPYVPPADDTPVRLVFSMSTEEPSGPLAYGHMHIQLDDDRKVVATFFGERED